MAEAESSDVPGCAGCAFTTTGHPAAIAETVSPPATEKASGKFDAPNTATGTVFNPNPVQELGLQDLTDNKDADSPVFGPAYHFVTLKYLDGSGTLTGR